MIKKVFGLILSIIGLVGVAAYSLPNIKKMIPFVSNLNDIILIAFSLIVLLAGLFITTRGGGRGGKQAKEVPIYHGKNVVGYRRH